MTLTLPPIELLAMALTESQNHGKLRGLCIFAKCEQYSPTMKQMTITLICSFIFKISFSQLNQTKLFFGDYESIEVRYIKSVTDKSNEVDIKNKLWGTKKLTLDSNGTFKIQFPVPWPTTIIGLERFSSGTWTRRNDTLFLNSYYGHKDLMKVKESETTANETQLKVNYESGGKEYFPYLEITINKKTLGIKRPLTKFPLNTVDAIKIKHFVGQIALITNGIISQ